MLLAKTEFWYQNFGAPLHAGTTQWLRRRDILVNSVVAGKKLSIAGLILAGVKVLYYQTCTMLRRYTQVLGKV